MESCLLDIKCRVRVQGQLPGQIVDERRGGGEGEQQVTYQMQSRKTSTVQPQGQKVDATDSEEMENRRIDMNKIKEQETKDSRSIRQQMQRRRRRRRGRAAGLDIGCRVGGQGKPSQILDAVEEEERRSSRLHIAYMYVVCTHMYVCMCKKGVAINISGQMIHTVHALLVTYISQNCLGFLGQCVDIDHSKCLCICVGVYVIMYVL